MSLVALILVLAHSIIVVVAMPKSNSIVRDLLDDGFMRPQLTLSRSRDDKGDKAEVEMIDRDILEKAFSHMKEEADSVITKLLNRLQAEKAFRQHVNQHNDSTSTPAPISHYASLFDNDLFGTPSRTAQRNRMMATPLPPLLQSQADNAMQQILDRMLRERGYNSKDDTTTYHL